jgi:ABC-2 type transport system permease protein
MISITRLVAVMHKEVLQLARDRLSAGMIVGIPLLQILLFGYAINTDVRHLRAAIADESGSQLARRLAADAQASQVVDFAIQVASAADLEELLRRGEITVGLHLPPDFDRRVLRRERAAAQLLVNGSDPTVLGVARQLTELDVRYDTEARPRERRSLIEVRNFYNPERRSSVFVVPGLFGVILSMTMVLFTAVSLVRERERGNLELLIMTPVRNVELMLGKVLPYVLIGLVQVALIIAVGIWLFGVRIAGTVSDVYVAAVVFIVANLTLGLVISTAAKNQFQAMQMTIFFYLPSILLSGFMFPYDGIPRPAQYIAELLPLTHFVRLVRGIILRGAPLAELGGEMHALGLFSAVMLTIAVLRFRKRLD